MRAASIMFGEPPFTHHSALERQPRRMRPWWIGVALSGLVGVARAEGAAGVVDCLKPGDMREMVAGNTVVPSVVAVRTARGAVPGAEIMRANLCRVQDKLIYIMVALRRDGRVVHVTIDAVSGRINSVR